MNASIQSLCRLIDKGDLGLARDFVKSKNIEVKCPRCSYVNFLGADLKDVELLETGYFTCHKPSCRVKIIVRQEGEWIQPV